MEIWAKIKGFPPYYEVSNLGNVRTIDHIDSMGRVKNGTLKKQTFDGHKHYLQVSLYKDGKQVSKNVHRLVAEAFIKNPLNLPEVNHIDENKTNNSACNLEWCDHKYNNNYGSKLQKISGENNPMSKIGPDIANFIYENHPHNGGHIKNKDLANMFSLSPTHVSAIAHGRRWNYGHNV